MSEVKSQKSTIKKVKKARSTFSGSKVGKYYYCFVVEDDGHEGEGERGDEVNCDEDGAGSFH